MKSRWTPATAVWVAFAVLLAEAAAAGPVEIPGRYRIGADLAARLDRSLRAGRDLSSPIPVTVRAAHPLTSDEIGALEGSGVAFRRFDGEIARVGLLYAARATGDGLAALAAHPTIARVLGAGPLGPTPVVPEANPFDLVHELTAARPVWGLRDARGRRLLGTGVTLCDIDSGLDPYHPMFFRADAGLFDWIDTDSNGVLDPGVDSVDLDGDGRAGPGERLRALGGTLRDVYTGSVEEEARGFVAGRSWLYADTNDDGKRNFGPAKGFTEADPAFGEPLFIVDDVDLDGTASTGEKLLRLGSSKIAGVYSLQDGRGYERGVDLLEFEGTSTQAHGTGVLGILAGGVATRTWVQGVAPDADLLLVDQHVTDSSVVTGPDFWLDSLVAGVAWAKARGAGLFVHEYGTQTGNFADGSGEFEVLLDTLSADGYPQLSATHNFAGFGGHAEPVVAAGETVEIPLLLSNDGLGFSVQFLYLTIRWRGGDLSDLAAVLSAPDGTEIAMEGTPEVFPYNPFNEVATSPRGTHMRFLVLGKLSQNLSKYVALDEGTWKVSLTNSATAPIQPHLAAADETGYAAAVSWDVETTDSGTIAQPSTADSAISVGASVGNSAVFVESPLGLKFFSGQGPRIDGALGIDIVAPDDHYTAYPGSAFAGSGDYMRFGGTSGALPQVAGAVALLLQAEPGLSPDDVRARVRASATGDAVTGAVPNPRWGFGRLDTHRLVTGQGAPDNALPQPRVGADPVVAYVGEPASLDASATLDPNHATTELTFRWDFDYDGIWDAEAHGDPTATLPAFTAPGTRWVKLEAEDPFRGFAQTLVRVTVSESPPGTAEPEPTADASEPDVGAALDVEPAGLDAEDPDGAGPVGEPASPSGDGGCSGAGADAGPPWTLLALALALGARLPRQHRLQPSRGSSGNPP